MIFYQIACYEGTGKIRIPANLYNSNQFLSCIRELKRENMLLFSYSENGIKAYLLVKI